MRAVRVGRKRYHNGVGALQAGLQTHVCMHRTVQHIYVPILYAVLGLKTRLQDITILYVYVAPPPVWPCIGLLVRRARRRSTSAAIWPQRADLPHGLRPAPQVHREGQWRYPH
jgi:hypothetical protein